MSDPTITEAVRSCVAEVCGMPVSAVTEDGKLLGYGMDSVRSLELILTLEERLEMRISETDPRFAKIETVRQLAAFVARQRGGA